MSSPDPESFGLLAKILGALTAVGLPLWGARSWLDGKFDKKADKEAVSKAIHEVKNELTIHRGYFKDVFNEMKDKERRDNDRHVELLGKIHEGSKR